MRLFRAAAVLVLVAGLMLVAARRIADLDTRPVHEREISMPLPGGAVRARVYEPEGGAMRATLLTSGLHVAGIDEPRLVRLARSVASNRIVVITPDIPQLARFDISPTLTDTIERAAGWIASDSGLDAEHRVGLMGISFSGGLSIVAAGRPSLAGKVRSVFAFGGHDDLPRVLKYLCTGQEPYPPHQIHLSAPGTNDAPFTRPPHDYGVAVILLGIADRMVPAPQVEKLRDGVRRYLFASALDTNVDKARAAAEFDALRATAKAMPEPSATLLRYVVERDVVHLGARLLPHLSVLGSDPALSVSKSPKPKGVPTFLLHGIEDNVIPSIESEYLVEDLRPDSPVRLLLSGLISHAEADRPVKVGDVMELASFWGDLLAR